MEEQVSVEMRRGRLEGFIFVILSFLWRLLLLSRIVNQCSKGKWFVWRNLIFVLNISDGYFASLLFEGTTFVIISFFLLLYCWIGLCAIQNATIVCQNM